jgi:hypothetical protein
MPLQLVSLRHCTQPPSMGSQWGVAGGHIASELQAVTQVPAGALHTVVGAAHWLEVVQPLVCPQVWVLRLHSGSCLGQLALARQSTQVCDPLVSQ